MDFSELMEWNGYIYLEKLLEPEDNLLRLLIGRSKEINAGLGIKHLPTIQIDFDFYVSYSVINECFDCLDEDEISKGKVFRIYTKSKYLDFIKSSTLEIEDICLPTNFVHYQFCCLNHIIDVISCNAPKITELTD
ncbi:hypothetical protein [Pseudobacillus wudalianchiensis]|uniref:Uncharacterized protein n=1 Tax=Pseudobacillus wudalianchiensis TaxID=1743143 RepID=A0A1B9B8Y9_9BACI|nr:hypothetical protein [Bacillus wudalianchiensis]OCA92574.1 hypothetical protein A8F95_02440 [Bacillus wudalianchiensis]